MSIITNYRETTNKLGATFGQTQIHQEKTTQMQQVAVAVRTCYDELLCTGYRQRE